MTTRGDDLPEPYNLGRSCGATAAMWTALIAVLAAVARKAGGR